MKRLLFSIVVLLQFALVGCVQETSTATSNNQQQSFTNFLEQKERESYNPANEIIAKENSAQFEKDIFKYVDSVGLFVNWRGVINDIKTEESGKTVAVKFDITYIPAQYRSITFCCTHLVARDSLVNDHIYNTIKNMPNDMFVYFDGLIRTQNNNYIDYSGSLPGGDLNTTHPDYEFWIVDVSPEQRCDTLTTDMQKAVGLSYELNAIMKEQYLGHTTQEVATKSFNELLPSFESVKSNLTDSEKSYITRLNQCLTYNYMYGGKE